MYQTRKYRFKTRRNNACSECYRRKQKCDRQRPCNVCTSRGVDSRCIYNYDSSTQDNPRADDKKARVYTDVAQADEDSVLSRPVDLATGVGYAVTTEDRSTALSDMLQHSGFDPEILVSHDHEALRSMLPPSRTKLNDALSRLPRLEVCQSLIQIYFDEANWYYTMLDRLYFEDSYRRWMLSCRTKEQTTRDREVMYFPALLFQVLALALDYVPPKSACECLLHSTGHREYDELSTRWVEAGEAVMLILGRRQPTVVSVQADLVRCAWLKNAGHGAEAWYALGDAVRQAQEIGLHLEPRARVDGQAAMSPKSLETAWHNEHKRRLWTTLFAWEGHMSLQFGRPRMINRSDCTVADPINCDLPLHPSQTLFRPSTPGGRPSLYRLALTKYHIALRIHEAMSTGAFSTNFDNWSALDAIQFDAEQLRNNIPKALQADAPDTSWDLQIPLLHRYRLLITLLIDAFEMALHRPHAARRQKSLVEAVRAAIRILGHAQQLFELTEKHHRKFYSLSFHTIDAGISLSTMLARFPRETAEYNREAMRALRQATTRLELLKEQNKAAVAGEIVLSQFIRKLERVPLENLADAAHAQQEHKNMADTTTFIDSESPWTAIPTAVNRTATAGSGLTDTWTEQPGSWDDIFADISWTSNWLEHFDSTATNNMFDMHNGGLDLNTFTRQHQLLAMIMPKEAEGS